MREGSARNPLVDVDPMDLERMTELWSGRLNATTDFERGYYQGRFEEYAAQNAISPDDFPSIRKYA